MLTKQMSGFVRKYFYTKKIGVQSVHRSLKVYSIDNNGLVCQLVAMESVSKVAGILPIPSSSIFHVSLGYVWWGCSGQYLPDVYWTIYNKVCCNYVIFLVISVYGYIFPALHISDFKEKHVGYTCPTNVKLY